MRTFKFVPLQTSATEGGVKLQVPPHSTTRSAAQTRVGGRVSTTVTVWLHWLTLVQLSTARQVRVALKVRPQEPRLFVTVLSTWMRTLVPSQISSAKGRVNSHGWPHSTMKLAAQDKLGGVVSTTVM